MTLFVETLAKYIKQQWDQALNASGGPREARLIVQSLDPDTTFELFSALDAHRLAWPKQGAIDCHFRVATGLWLDWLRSNREATEQFTQRKHWIDRDDRLTAYRNLVRPADKDGLVVVLVGLNHATDQGGLSGFHLVDEKRIWQHLGQSFIPWINTLNKRLALSGSEREIEQFDERIHSLFEIQPLQLARLAGFLEHEVISDSADLYSLGDLIERFHAKLPYWDIPPLLTNSRNKRQAQGQLKKAATFISHQRFKSTADQRKAWKKLEDAFANSTLELPQTTTPDLYADLDDYRKTLHAFIHKIDAQARERLLQTDLTPVLDALEVRQTRSSGSTQVPKLSGASLDVMLQAVWMTLVVYQKKHPQSALFESLSAINIHILSFNHDLQEDSASGIGDESIARDLLRGCLGGLPAVVENIDWRLPVDSDQIDEPREQWGRPVELTLTLDTETVKLGKSRARPYVRFDVTLETHDDNTDEDASAFRKPFQWAFGPTHPERVRYEGARLLIKEHGSTLIDTLPAFQVPAVNLTALYYAADEEEANRLASQALGELELINLLDGLAPDVLAPELAQAARELSQRYRQWLDAYVSQGYYDANDTYFLPLLNNYVALAEGLLDPNVRGSAELLRRFYKAFLLVDDRLRPNDAFLRAAVAWGGTPAVIELTYWRVRFLCDGFPEVASDLVLGRKSEASFTQLLNLAEIHRPLAGLVVNAERKLSAEIKSFGLLHHLGEPPNVEKSLAVQTLLREDDSEENVSEDIRPREESAIVVQVLTDYLRLYPFAEDGLRILALHVEELGIILSGVDAFLRDYLKRSSADWPAFHCELMVYTTSSSPMAMENRLMAWRDELMARYRERGRPLALSVGHRFAPTREKIAEMARQETRLYDVAFLFRFLAGELIGEAEPASPFEFDYNHNNVSPFPIAEYPRPIQLGDVLKRQSLLSNRRLRIQTRHADLSARLRHPQDKQHDHLIFGRIDFTPWAGLVDGLHARAHWVACIDPFVDKRLLRTAEGQERRKILGFTSGLGAYGELNLSISTEQDTLGQLAEMVQGELIELLPFQDAAGFAEMAERVIEESEEIIGLSALHAVVGEGQKVREVVGFAAIRRLLATPADAAMTQLLPIDSLLHWFKGSDGSHRPDLLQLSLILREGEVPLIQATLMECKLSQQNPEHLNKALLQTQDGLSHLTQLLIPNRCDIQRVSFDRRYWWAQLQRAMTSRGVVNLAESEWRRLDKALEQITEGYFEIAWRAAIFTFWTDTEGATPSLTALPLPLGTIQTPLWAPDGFAIWHVALGHDGLMALFDETTTFERLELDSQMIRIGPDVDPVEPAAPVTPPEQDVAGGTESAPKIEPTSRWTIAPMPAFSEMHQPTERHWPDPTGSAADPADSTDPLDLIDSRPVIDSDAPSSGAPTQSEHLTVPSVPVGFALPEKLLIGTRANGEAVYWHYGHPSLSNRHLLIFGASGSGKTYGIQCLLAEMAGQGLNSLIIDYTDGFLPNQVEPLFEQAAKPKNHFVVQDRLPLTPFKQQEYEVDPSRPKMQESPYQVASRIASIIISVYASIGDQQKAALMRVLEDGIAEDAGFTLDKLLIGLRGDGQYGESLASKLEPLIKAEPFREGVDSAWDGMLTDGEHAVHVLQLKGLGRDVQKLVTEFALWDLYDFACNNGNKNRPIPVVLDEIQNLDHSSDSPIDKMLREGRKFGLSLLLATQTTSQFDQEGRDRLFQAGHKLFFKPADTEVDRFATLLSQTTAEPRADWRQRLSNLHKGQCWSLGPVLTSSGKLQEKAILVSVTALEQRRLRVDDA